MKFQEIQNRALEIRKKYSQYEKKLYGKEWTREDILNGFIGDIGDLVKLTQALKGIRKIDKYEKKLAHEISDCLWSILVLASKYGIDLEKEFLKNMDKLEKNIDKKLQSN